jgi:DNA-binding IclR family transcriptional regulator
MKAISKAGAGERGTYQIRALDRGLDLLEAFTVQDPELSIGQIRERTGLPKPTIVRLLSVLTERGYIERVAGAERFRLGVRTLEVGSVYIQSTSLEAEARPIMRRLADQTGQTANLGILDKHQVVHIEVVAPDRPVRFWASIGKREEAYLSGLGKVLLTGLPDDELAAYLRRPREMMTPNTLAGADELHADLERTSERGYAIDNEESNPGVLCIAAAIRNGKGQIAAAVSISGPRVEFDNDGTMQRYIGMVQSAAREISRRLGWTGNAGEQGSGSTLSE